MDAEFKREFNRLNVKVNNLYAIQNKETWVKVGFVTDLTGWKGEKLRQAREQGLIEWKMDAKLGRVYKLESIPSIFIRHENNDKRGLGMDVPGDDANQKIGNA